MKYGYVNWIRVVSPLEKMKNITQVISLGNLLLVAMMSTMNMVYGQSQLAGTVLDENQQPLDYANVLLLNALDSTFLKGEITNEDGTFVINNINEGKVFLQVTMVGYEPYYSSPINLSQIREEQAPLEIILKANNLELEEVIVTAQKPLLQQTIDRLIINVQNSIVATGTNALTILERSPGIEIDWINNQILMQGKQGVIVLLDGKRIQMETAGLIQLLRGLSSDNIVSIELITTPPASFDAEGDAGVINIITKKMGSDGFNLTTTLNTAYGFRPKYGGSFSLNLKKDRFNFFADGNGMYNLTQEDLTITRENRYQGIVTTTDIISYRPASTGLYNYRMGLDFDLSDRTTIGGLFAGYIRTWKMDADMNAEVRDDQQNFFRSRNLAFERNDWSHWMGNLNIQHRFNDEANLAVHFDYLTFSEENPVDYLEEIISQNGEILEMNDFFSRKFTDVDFRVFKMDYARPLSKKWQLETGVKGSLSAFTNDIQLANKEQEGYVDDPRFTDVYQLEESLGALYSSVNFHPNAMFSIKGGLRYEYYHSDLGSKKEGSVLFQSYGRIFPSLFMSYQLAKEQQIQLAYSERITRPSIRWIAPAFAFVGYNTILGGNPDILPTINQKVNLSYRNKNFLLQFQFSDDDNALTFQPSVFEEDNLILTRSANMPDLKTVMVGLNFPIQVKPWWSSRFVLSAYWFHLEPFFEGESFTYTNKYMTANIVNNFKLSDGMSLELSSKYNSARRIGLGVVPEKLILDLGIQKAWSSKFNMTLNWSDIFNLGSFYGIEIDEPDLNLVYDWHYDVEGNVVRLNVTYQFGQESTKGKKKRATGSEEERSRMN